MRIVESKDLKTTKRYSYKRYTLLTKDIFNNSLISLQHYVMYHIIC